MCKYIYTYYTHYTYSKLSVVIWKLKKAKRREPLSQRLEGTESEGTFEKVSLVPSTLPCRFLVIGSEIPWDSYVSLRTPHHPAFSSQSSNLFVFLSYFHWAAAVKAPPYHQGEQCVEPNQTQVFTLLLLDAFQYSCRALHGYMGSVELRASFRMFNPFVHKRLDKWKFLEGNTAVTARFFFVCCSAARVDSRD